MYSHLFMSGMNMKGAHPALRAFMILLLASIIVWPIGYLAHWTFLGGREREIDRDIRQLLSQNPEELAAKAVASGRYALYCSGSSLETIVPGYSYPLEAYRDSFGYHGFNLYSGPDLTEEQIQNNERALEFLARYNRYVYAEANRHIPDWRERYEKKRLRK
ncbi:MAG: hypothetical protein U1E27_11795 [Kiritimatiellia bacterium]|nr:hypothetical protein [Kiritimatiellia bacterium]